MINNDIKDLEACYACIDGLIVCRVSREEHFTHLYVIFYRLSRTYLAVNRGKSDLCQAIADYVEHTVGQGRVKPIIAKIDVIDFLQL